MTARIAVVGVGHVGSVVAGCLAVIGHDVIGVEIDRAKLDRLHRGEAPFFEPGVDELLAAAVGSGRLRFTDDIGDGVRGSDVIFLCVGTPTTDNGHADTTALEAAA